MQIPINNYRLDFPIMLKPEESFDYTLQYGKIDEIIKKNIDNGKVTLKDKVYVHITDASGGNYYKNTKKAIRDLVEKIS